MKKEQIKNLLQQADQLIPNPDIDSVNLIGKIRRRAILRRTIRKTIPIAAAAMILIAFSIWTVAIKQTQTTQKQEQIASLEAKVQQLQTRTDAMLNLISDVLDREQKQLRLTEARARLADMADPLEEVHRQIDKTAFILLYQADRRYNQLNLKDSAIQTYKRVLELFPQTESAKTAKQRLQKIRNERFKKGDLL